jgi:hypothetical protein
LDTGSNTDRVQSPRLARLTAFEEQKRAMPDQNRPPVYLVTLFHKSGNAAEAITDSAELESVYDDFDAEQKAWDWVNQNITAKCTSFNISKNGSVIRTFSAIPV